MQQIKTLDNMLTSLCVYFVCLCVFKREKSKVRERRVIVRLGDVFGHGEENKIYISGAGRLEMT